MPNLDPNTQQPYAQPQPASEWVAPDGTSVTDPKAVGALELGAAQRNKDFQAGAKAPEGNIFQTTVNPALKQSRDEMNEFATNLLFGPSDIAHARNMDMARAATKAAFGVFNPMPSNMSDIGRDAAMVAANALIPGSGAIARAARMGATAGGGMIGSAIQGDPYGTVVARGIGTVPATALGEVVHAFRVGANKAQGEDLLQPSDVSTMRDAFNQILTGDKLEGGPQQWFSRINPRREADGIKSMATQRYQGALNQIEELVGQHRSFNMTPFGGNDSMPIREVMDYLSSDKLDPVQQRTAKQFVLNYLQRSGQPGDAAAANTWMQADADMSRNMTVHRLLSAPDVIDSETGQLNMNNLRAAYINELKAGRIPSNIQAPLQEAMQRGAGERFPEMDRPGKAGPLARNVGRIGGLVGGTMVGHPGVGMHAGGEAMASMIGPRRSVFVGTPENLSAIQPSALTRPLTTQAVFNAQDTLRNQLQSLNPGQ